MSLRQEIRTLLLDHPLAQLTAKEIAAKLSRHVALRTVRWHLQAIRAATNTNTASALPSRQCIDENGHATVEARPRHD